MNCLPASSSLPLLTRSLAPAMIRSFASLFAWQIGSTRAL